MRSTIKYFWRNEIGGGTCHAQSEKELAATARKTPLERSRSRWKGLN
jgi:hypothetical protein